MNIGLLGKGNCSDEKSLVEQIRAGALNMALALSGCTNGIETGLSAPEGIPVTVFAEISPVTKSGEAIGHPSFPAIR